MDWDKEFEEMQRKRTTTTQGGRSRSTVTPGRSVFGDEFNADDDDGDENPFAAGSGARRDVRMANPEEPPSFIEEEREQTPLEQLTRHWMNERHAPDILPAHEELLSNLLDHLRRQSEAVQLLRGDPTTSEEEHIRIMLVQTEVERVKFIVRSYVRTRLYKVEKYARYIATNADIQTRLTAAERDHAIRHARITDQHFYLSVLQSLPEAQSHLDDTPIFVPPMVTEPDMTRPVFVHALKQCPPIRLPDGATLEMKKGHISLVPYSVVENLVAREEVELI